MHNYNASIYHYLSWMTKLIDLSFTIQHNINDKVCIREVDGFYDFAVDVFMCTIEWSPHKCAARVYLSTWCIGLQPQNCYECFIDDLISSVFPTMWVGCGVSHACGASAYVILIHNPSSSPPKIKNKNVPLWNWPMECFQVFFQLLIFALLQHCFNHMLNYCRGDGHAINSFPLSTCLTHGHSKFMCWTPKVRLDPWLLECEFRKWLLQILQMMSTSHLSIEGLLLEIDLKILA
jgi:hypothetical protein